MALQPVREHRRGHPVHGAQQLEALHQRQVPPQLAALAEYHADAACQLAAPAHRLQPAHPDVARAASSPSPKIITTASKPCPTQTKVTADAGS
ncbi:MAG: hypothetical protein ACRDRO_18650 [Pseudonocardiaceae bacterium]